LGLRAQRLTTLAAPCFGELTALPEAAPPPAAPALLAPHRVRAAVTEAAKEVVDGFFAAELDRLAPHLAEHVTVWGLGRLQVAPSAALLNALDGAHPEAVQVIPSDYRSYQPAELRAVLPRGHGALMAAAVAHRPGALAITARLEGRAGEEGRVLVFAAPDPGGSKWRICSLPLPSPDDVVVAGARLSAGEDLALRVADRVARAVWLGQAPLVTAQRNDLMRVVWWGGEALAPEAVPERVAARDVEAASWSVFGRPEEVARPQSMGSRAGGAVPPLSAGLRPAARSACELASEQLREVERAAEKHWRARWVDLRPRWFRVPVGRWDPEARSTVPHTELVCLLLRQEDRDVREETRQVWRVGGIWL
ncbi:MAG: hypothetical protein KC933_15290, partial [Myxococcales bacterium]|nr:hypothetical protein [Myxococcales bacterium]